MAYAFNDDKSKLDLKKTWIDIPIVSTYDLVRADAGIFKYCIDSSGTVTLAGSLILKINSGDHDTISIPEAIRPADTGDGGLGWMRQLGRFRQGNGVEYALQLNPSSLSIDLDEAIASTPETITFEVSYNPRF